MDDKLSSIKLYLFYSTNVDQLQDQKLLPVKDKKDISSAVTLTYVDGVIIERKPFGRKINPTKF